MSRFVPLERLAEEGYGQVICYPKYDLGELEKRLIEMHQLGVKALCFTGEKNVANTPVLGKGCVGIVILACTEDGEAALKIRRTDADRAGMRREAEMLQNANSVGVGPKLLGFTDNVLMMEFIDGLPFPKWIENLEEKADTRLRVRGVLREILDQAWRLDEIGLDHGELSQASKHILIDAEDKAYLLDFESASVSRRASNVTSICQFLFMNAKIADLIVNRLGEIKKENLLAALRTYKREPVRKNFDEILRMWLL